MRRRSFLKGLAAAACALTLQLKPLVPEEELEAYYDEVTSWTMEHFAPKVIDQVFTQNNLIRRMLKYHRVGEAPEGEMLYVRNDGGGYVRRP